MREFTFVIRLIDNDEEYVSESHSVPGKYSICPRCEGEGKILNPNIGEVPVTQEEWERDWSEEDKNEYMKGGRGIYGVDCPNNCDNGKVIIPDMNRLNPEQKKLVDEYNKQKAEDEAERLADLRTMRGEMGIW